MRWDFSMVAPQPTYERQQQILTRYLNVQIRAFARKYQTLLADSVMIDETYATASLLSLLSAVQQSGHKLYLLVDEYDNFANEVLMGGQPSSQERYEALVFGEGEFKGVFKAIKGAMAGLGLDRVFIVGVSPLVLHVKNDAAKVAKALYAQGEMQALCEFIEQQLFPVFDNRDYLQINELTLKTAFLTLLFNDTFYIMDSETELQRGYADLTMILRPEMRRFTLLDILLEFKLVKLAELKLSGQQIQQMKREDLQSLAPVQTQLQEAIGQAQRYRAVLENKYADKLRLRSYAVVAIGFERLVWQPVD